LFKEVVVVEGKDDEAAVKRAIQVEVITTNGLGITRQTLELISTAQKRCGVIIFTDPDYPGEKIRRIIDEAVPGCRHAYLSQKNDNPRKKRIGVEYASVKEIIDALSIAKVTEETRKVRYTAEDLYKHRLTGQSCSRELRYQIGMMLGLGQTNAKQFLNRLNAYGITAEEFQTALDAVLKG